MRLAPLVTLLCLGSLCAQELVVPTANTHTDADDGWCLPGISGAIRQQLVIDAANLQPMIGRTITALSFRRNAVVEDYAAATANLVVSISHSPRSAADPSPVFAANHGNSPTTVFQGTLSAPFSPYLQDRVGDWRDAGSVRVTFSTPFTYVGGNLCVDLDGTAAGNVPFTRWMIDAATAPSFGSATEVAPGCGAYGGSNHEWASIDASTLVPGAAAKFGAFGLASAPALLVIAGIATPAGMPLPPIGSASNCSVNVNAILGTVPAVFHPIIVPRVQHTEGYALVNLQLPAQGWMLGARLAAQWIDLGQFATSNAMEWTVTPSFQGLGMARVSAFHTASGSPTQGEVDLSLVPVVRFEFQ